MTIRIHPMAAVLALGALAACGGADGRQSVLDTLRRDSAGRAARLAAAARAAADSARAVAATADTAPTAPPAAAAPESLPPANRYRPLPPLVQTIADAAVLAPRSQEWFVAAVRARRLLVDVGRLDIKPRSDEAWRRAFQQVVEGGAPVRVGTMLRARGPWGVEDVRVNGFDTWNGRIVATLEVSPSLDSLVRRHEAAGTAQRIVPPPVVDSATLVASATTPGNPSPIPAGTTTGARPSAAGGSAAARPGTTPATTDTTKALTCRDTLPTLLSTRVTAVRDSLVTWLTDSLKVPLPRLARANRIESWSAAGCFGTGRALVLVSRRNPTGELATERAMLVDTTGALMRLRVLDYRFHAHEPLYVADVDGDGVDDLVARGYGVFSGGTTALRLDPVARVLRRVAAGFAWESR